MIIEILNNITVNISILAFIGFFLSRIKRFRMVVFDHNKTWIEIILLSLVFGLIGIFSTYTGVNINGAIANTRVIGVIAGGFLAGPAVGLLAGIIAGMHRFIIDVGGFTAVSCAISTIAEGMIGGYMYPKVRFSKYKYHLIFAATFVAEIVQMIIILIIAKPFSEAVELVRIISIPMVFLNPVGVTIFIYAINVVQETTQKQNQHTMDLVFKIIDQSLPHLRKGLDELNSLKAISKIICELTQSEAVLMFNLDRNYGFSGPDFLKNHSNDLINYILRLDSNKHKSFILQSEKLNQLDLPKEILSIHVAPIVLSSNIVCYVVLMDKKLYSDESSEIIFIDRLTQLFSSQLSQIQLDKQTQLLQKAELNALQSQINPHFLFNALNAISGYTRENPEQARSLLLSLSSYFRNTLSTSKDFIDIQDEIEHVLSYVEIEKARFEDKLEVKIDCDPQIHFEVPNFIIQPLIENSIKHGMKNTGLIVQLSIKEFREYYHISIDDNGKGMSEDELKSYLNPNKASDKIGLNNIQKRLMVIYHMKNPLIIESSLNNGTHIVFDIPKVSAS